MRKLMLMMMMVVLLVGTVSAFDLAYDNFKDVSPDNLSIKYVDAGAIGGDTILAEFDLRTPKSNIVGVSPNVKIKVFEYDIKNTYEPVEEMIGSMDFYNIKDRMKPVQVDVDLKYKVVTNEKGFTRECGYSNITKSELCGDVPYDRNITTWEDYNPRTILKDEVITISGWATTEEGDSIEWISTFYDGKLRIEEWAAWNAGMNVGIVYYALNESTGLTFIDSAQYGMDGAMVNTENGDWVAGKIGNGIDLDGTDEYGSPPNTAAFTNLFDNRDWSASMWVKSGPGLSGLDYEAFWWGSTEATKQLRLYYYDSRIRFAVLDSTWESIDYTVDMGAATWYHIAVRYDHAATNTSLWVDGDLKDYDNTMHTFNPASNSPHRLGSNTAGGQYFDGIMDEVSFANRSWTDSEIVDIQYNGGSGNTYTNTFTPPDTVPAVTLVGPADNFVSPYAQIIFNATVTDNYEVKNVSLWVNGTLNQTNTTKVNGTYNKFNYTFAEGTWNWSIVAYDNNTGINASATRTFVVDTTPQIYMFSPLLANNSNYTTSTIYFNATVAPAVNEWKVNYNGSNFTLSAINTSLTVADGLSYNVKLYAKNAASGVYGLNSSIYFSVDTTDPAVNVTYPYNSPLISYHKNNDNLQLNWTATDLNLGSCWVQLFNQTNQTQTCNVNTTNVNITNVNNNNLTFWVNDTVGNYVGYPVNWTYQIFENNRSYNLNTTISNNDTYYINLVANNSLTTVKMLYNGTLYSLANNAGNWSVKIDVPKAAVGFNSFYFSGDYAGTIINTSASTQTANDTAWFNCNTTYFSPYMNLTFYDEATLAQINATIPTSNWDYYTGSGTVNKSTTFVQVAAVKYNYTFCAAPNYTTMSVLPYVQYASTGYPQRIWNPSVQSYNLTMATQKLYLLASADGIYVTFQVLSTSDVPIQGVTVTATRTISGTSVNVGTGTTDAAGGVTMWLNPDFVHTFSFAKTGYTTYSTSFAPTQASYTVKLGGGTSSTINDYTRGINMLVNPLAGTLSNYTDYTFNFTLASSYWTVDNFGFRLRLDNGTVINSTNALTNGGTVQVIGNARDYDRITMEYYYIINGTTMPYTASWNVFNTNYTQWSIKTFFTDLDAYVAVGFFGLDSFGFYFLIFMSMFLAVGILGYKYGITHPLVLSGLLFAVVFFFDVVVDLLPEIVGAVPNILTYIAALILTISIVKEVQV